jgi:hypothetical protein
MTSVATFTYLPWLLERFSRIAWTDFPVVLGTSPEIGMKASGEVGAMKTYLPPDVGCFRQLFFQYIRRFHL